MNFNLKSIIPKRLSMDRNRDAESRKTPSKNPILRIRDPKAALNTSIIVLICLIFVLEFGFAISIYGFKSDDAVTKQVARIVPYPAAFTASGIVTVSQYWKEKDYIEHFYASTKQEAVNSNDLSNQILKQEAENQIIKKEALKYKLNVSKKDVDAAMDQIYENNGGQAEVEKALKDLYGLDVNSFKELVKTQLLRDAINKEVIKHISARHILIRVEENAPQDKVDEAKNRLQGYLNEIKSGSISFEDAAKKYSEDVGSNQDGGLLEDFARGDMVKEFEDVAFKIKIGEISEPFRTSFGWHIVKVESMTGYVDKSFDEWLSGLMKNNLFFELYRDNG